MSAVLKLGSGQASADGLADMEATFSFNCQAGAKATFIDAELFAAFPRFARLEVQVAGPHGQRQTG